MAWVAGAVEWEVEEEVWAAATVVLAEEVVTVEEVACKTTEVSSKDTVDSKVTAVKVTEGEAEELLWAAVTVESATLQDMAVPLQQAAWVVEVLEPAVMATQQPCMRSSLLRWVITQWATGKFCFAASIEVSRSFNDCEWSSEL